jgi:hypothetical protein
MEFEGQIPHFLQQYLGKPAFALPKGAQWVVDFNGLENVQQAIQATADSEPAKWDITPGLNLLVSKNKNKEGYRGCLFCQAVYIPGETSIANPEGIQKNHYLGTTTGDGRGFYSPTGLRMTFLETNVSFVENVIRPWVVTTARLGMIARPKGSATQYRENITVYKLGVISQKEPPFILQQYDFYDTCPVEVSPEEYNYAVPTAPVLREATFVYNYYKLQTNKNNKAISQNSINQPIPLPTVNSPYPNDN